MRTWYLAPMLGAIFVARIAVADVRCMYGGQFYGPGSMSCQAGAEAQCVNGSWKLTGSECAGQAADPSDEEAEPGVVAPRVGEPQVVQPGVGSARPPSTSPGGD